MRLDKEYLDHSVYNQLSEYADFYNTLAYTVMGFITQGTKAFGNLDSYVYSSITGTLESMATILKNGRINDSYSLLRKYYDSTIINTYSNIYLRDNFSIDDFIVQQIDNWRKGSDQLPEYRIMSRYIRESSRVSEITSLLYKDERYKKIRDRCNDHTHYNYYHNVLLNDNEIYLGDKRIKALDDFANDLEDIFIQHLAYMFYINEHYMASSDYMDSLEMGMTPEEGTQYLVASFVQEIFDKVIKPKRRDIFEEIKKNTSMKLN